MTTWTMDQVMAVRRLFVTAAIDRGVMAQAGATEGVRDHLAGQLKHAAHVLAVEIDTNDVRMIVKDAEYGPPTWLIEARAAWAPETKTIELRGGPMDGQVWQVTDVWSPVVVPIRHGVSFAQMDEVPSVALRTGRYDIDGWREDERRWVFAYRGECP